MSVNRLAVLFLSILLVGLVCVNLADAAWEATLHAESSDHTGVYQYNVIIGTGAIASTVVAPPLPPEYTVLMELHPSDWSAAYSRQIKLANAISYQWILGVDPHGNVGPPTARTSTISWTPAQFGICNSELRSGYDGTGPVVVADMITTTSYNVTGTQSPQYFTISATCDYAPTSVGYSSQWLMITLVSLMGAGGYLIRRRTAQQ